MAQKLKPDAPNAKPVVRCTRGFVKLPTEVMASRYFLSRSLYKNCQKRLRRPLLKLMRNDVDSNDFASNPNSDLLDVLASDPCPRPHLFDCCLRSTYYQLYQSSHKRSITLFFDKNSVRILNHIMWHETYIDFLFRINVSSAEHWFIIHVIHICT